jgi:hypothetical protein
MSVLAALERAQHALSHARTVQEVLTHHAAAKAAAVYAREQKLGREVVRKARAVVFEALRRLGGFLTLTDRAVGGRPYHVGTGTHRVPVATLDELGIDKNTSSWAQQLYHLPPEDFAAVRDGCSTLRRLLTDRKRARDLAEAMRFARSMHIDADDCDLRVCGHRELFTSGFRPDAVITAPPAGRKHLQVFPELASACKQAGVSFVAVQVSPRHLFEVGPQLCAYLPYQWAIPSGDSRTLGGNVLLLFADDAAMERGRHRIKGTEAWASNLIERFTEPGQLVCDPFLNRDVAIAALQLKRRFVGAHVDGAVIETARQKIEDECAIWEYRRRSVPRVSSSQIDSPRA